MCMVAFAGASVASFFFDQGAVSLGASGAVFGLFAVAVLLKLKFRFQKLVCLQIASSCHSQQRHGHHLQAVVSVRGSSKRWAWGDVNHLDMQVEGLVLGQFVIKQVLQVRAACSPSCAIGALHAKSSS